MASRATWPASWAPRGVPVLEKLSFSGTRENPEVCSLVSGCGIEPQVCAPPVAMRARRLLILRRATS